MSKPFFFRIESADLLNFATDPDGEGMSLLKFAKELQRGSSDIPFIQSVIDETLEFSQKKRNAANKRWSAEKMQTDAVHSTAMPVAVTEAVAETIAEPKDEPTSPAKADDCPHKKIIDAYHLILPSLPIVQVWNESSRANLRSRWREDKERQSVEWWSDYFNRVASSDFLMGKVKDWRASLSWLVGPKNFEKVLNGLYENKSNTSYDGDW